MRRDLIRSVVQHPYARLLLILCSAGLVLAARSSVGDPKLGAARLSRPPESLESPLPRPARRQSAQKAGAPNHVGEAGVASPTASAPERSRSARPLFDESSQRILLFGDSMVPIIADRLADYCQESGHRLYPVVWYGSTIIYWGWEDKLDKLLAEFNPSMVIASLGSSELAVRDVGECESFVGMILRKVGGRKFAWIGPPNWRDDTGVNAMLARALGPRRFFRFGGLHIAREADGIHPTPAGATVWVDSFARWLIAESDSPIRLDWPSRSVRPVIARVYAPHH